MKCSVKLIWDSETCKWYTDAGELLSLNLESGSFDALVERVKMAAPEMLELDYGYTGPVQITFEAVRIENLDMVSWWQTIQGTSTDYSPAMAALL